MNARASLDGYRQGEDRSTAIRFIVLIGVVSLFGDMTYEGARSVGGPFLASLNASATVVGVVAGLGELFGYGIRLVSGYAGDRTGRYWAVTIVGYVINLFSVPLLALAAGWQLAAVFMVSERMGRALRTPTRNAMLSHAATQTGAGWAFGLHESLDTTGAILGPLVVSASLYLGWGYKASFAILVVPALLAIFILLLARTQFPNPHDLEADKGIARPHVLHREFWIFSASAAFVAAGYADFSLLAYHFSKAAVVSSAWIPILYAVAMLAAAAAAIMLGRLFDRMGFDVLIPATVVSAASAPLAFLGGPAVATIGVLCWGVGMDAQESVMRAVIGEMAPRGCRATAFGLFDAMFGIAWFIGSVLLGILYDHSIVTLVIVSFGLQLLAIPILIVANSVRRS